MLRAESFKTAKRAKGQTVFDLDLQERFRLSAQSMRRFICDSMPDIHAGMSDASWDRLADAIVELIPDLTVEGEVEGRRRRFGVQAYFAAEPMAFFFESPDVVGLRELGGSIIAETFEVPAEQRLRLSLAWADSWQRSSQPAVSFFPIVRRSQQYLEGGEDEDQDVPNPFPLPKKPSRPSKQPALAPAKRALVTCADVEPIQVRVRATPPTGALVTSPRPVTVRQPGPGQGGQTEPDTTGPRAYTDRERETRALELLGKMLAPRGLLLTDVRDQPVGADAIDNNATYYEMKAHASKASGPLEMTAREVLKAREMGERYVLVIAEHLEESETSSPRFTFVPNPMGVLQVHPVGGIEVAGYDDAAFESWEFIRTRST